jgi:hypothetical protein
MNVEQTEILMAIRDSLQVIAANLESIAEHLDYSNSILGAGFRLDSDSGQTVLCIDTGEVVVKGQVTVK